MNVIKRLLFIIFIFISTMAIGGPVKIAIADNPIPEPAQMLMLGICLVGLASFSRKKIYKK